LDQTGKNMTFKLSILSFRGSDFKLFVPLLLAICAREAHYFVRQCREKRLRFSGTCFYPVRIMETTKVDLLERAFTKAVDVSMNSINEADLQECFGDLKLQLGGTLQKQFVNMISKAGLGMEDSFKQVNSDYDVEAYIRASSHSSSAGSSSAAAAAGGSAQAFGKSPDAILQEVVNNLKKAEIEDLQKSLRVLEAEIKKAREQALRFRTQLFNEVDAIKVENMKILTASEDIAKTG